MSGDWYIDLGGLGTAELLAITGVSHIQLNVTDLEASTEWYKTVVGLTQLQAAPGRYAVLTPAAVVFGWV